MRQPYYLLVIVVLCGAACKSDREKATAIVEDKSLAPAEALVRAGHVIWHDTSTIHHTITAEQRGPAWRVFVIVDRPDKPGIEQRDGTTVLTFYRYLDGHFLGQTQDMWAAGESRNVHDIMIADRYRVDVNGRMTTVVAPSRTVTDGMSMQSFDSWEPGDMAKLQPYDLVMNHTATVVTPK